MNDNLYPDLPLSDGRTPLEHAEDTISHMADAITELWEALDTALCALDECVEYPAQIKTTLNDYDLESSRKTHKAYNPEQEPNLNNDGSKYSAIE
jgi:hypothetical protein